MATVAITAAAAAKWCDLCECTHTGLVCLTANRYQALTTVCLPVCSCAAAGGVGGGSGDSVAVCTRPKCYLTVITTTIGGGGVDGVPRYGTNHSRTEYSVSISMSLLLTAPPAPSKAATAALHFKLILLKSSLVFGTQANTWQTRHDKYEMCPLLSTESIIAGFRQTKMSHTLITTNTVHRLATPSPQCFIGSLNGVPEPTMWTGCCGTVRRLCGTVQVRST